MIDYQAHFPAANTAIPPDPTAVPAREAASRAATARAESEPQFTNDVLVHEARMRAGA